MVKITVIGAGNLGSAIAYEIASRGLCNEMVLIDIIADLAEGNTLDILQALPFKNRTKIWSGDYPLMKDSDIVIITAGKPRTPDMKDRLELAAINVKIMDGILSKIKEFSPESIIITLTNPMDIMNHHIVKQGFARNKVIGSGGQLDSSRLRVCLGHPEKEVEAFVLGEHGENQIPIFSKISIDRESCQFSAEEKQELMEKIRVSSLKVIEKKKATIFAPASNTSDMVEAIVKDQKRLMCCSANLLGEYGLTDVSLGVPVILGKRGIEKIEQWPLEAEELNSLQKTGLKLKEFYEKIAR
ncbi:malate dehydrogenase [Candidatus Woesearchaeota archaeon]|nr:malate dehydrogenase [Candidatus Woesearchaeota archaeon]